MLGAGDAFARPPAEGMTALACTQLAMDDALAVAAQAHHQLAAGGDNTREAAALDCLARSQIQLGQGVPALETARRLLALLDQAPGLPQAGLARLHAAEAMAQAGQAELARPIMIDTYLQARLQGDHGSEIAALTAIGADIGLRLRDAPTAALYLQQAVRLAHETGQPARPALYQALLVEIDRVRSDAASTLLAELRRIPSTQGDGIAMKWRLDTAEARIDINVTQPLVALPLLQAAAQAQRAIHDVAGLRDTLLAMGLAESYLNRPDQARLHSLASLALAEASQSDTIPALHQLLDISFKSQDRAGIEHYGQRLLKLGSKERRKRWRQNVQAIVARIGPPLPAAPGRPALPAQAHAGPTQAGWLVWASLLLGGAAISLAWHQRRHFRRRLQLSGIDPLCQVLTRRELTSRIDLMLGPAPEPGVLPMLLVLVDVDHFKHINDRHGHLIGDAALTEIAARLKRSCRDQDILGRWGGEEFLLAGRVRDIHEATLLAEGIRAAVAGTPIQVEPDIQLEVTVSIGAAPWPFIPGSTDDWRQALKPADKALYMVKRTGRDGWAVLQATSLARDHAMTGLLDDPAAAQARLLLDIRSSRPLQSNNAMHPAA